MRRRDSGQQRCQKARPDQAGRPGPVAAATKRSNSAWDFSVNVYPELAVGSLPHVVIAAAPSAARRRPPADQRSCRTG